MLENSIKPTTIKNTKGDKGKRGILKQHQYASRLNDLKLVLKLCNGTRVGLDQTQRKVQDNLKLKGNQVFLSDSYFSDLFNQSDLNPALQYPFKGTSDFFDALVIIPNDNLFAVQRC